MANPCSSSNMKKYSCTNCIKRNSSLLSELSNDELDFLNSNRYTVSYKVGETICKEGTKSLGLICLNKGKVKMTRSSMNGSEQILTLKKPVDFIGFRTLMNDNTYLSSAVVLEDTTVCIIDKKVFFKVLANNEQLAFKIIRYLAQELDELDDRMVNLFQKHVRARMADALLLINNIYGTNTNGTLAVSLRRLDIAALSNMTVSNVSRVLSSFSKEKLIETNKRDIKIINLKALKSLSVFG